MRGSTTRLRLPGILAAITVTTCAALRPVLATDRFDLSIPQTLAQTEPAPVPDTAPTVNEGSLSAYFAAWAERVPHARATQPRWSSPLATTTGLLEQRVRFDIAQQHARNGTDTTVLDSGRGLDLIVADATEI